MKIRLYQINPDRDTFRVKHARLSRLKEYSGNANVNSEIYDQVFEGKVDCHNLEDVYSLFNRCRPAGFYGHDMCVSDVVEVIYSDGSSRFYYCDDSGFIKIQFLPLAQNRPHMLYRPKWGICPESITPDIFWGTRAVIERGSLELPQKCQSYHQAKCITKREEEEFLKWLVMRAIPRLRAFVLLHRTSNISFRNHDERFFCIAEDDDNHRYLHIGAYMR